MKSLFAEPYLSTDPKHQGLILHSIYHRPNNWDFIPPGKKIPCGESSMWATITPWNWRFISSG